MVLDPVFAIISPGFYRRVAAQAWWRSALFLVYVSALLALMGAISMKIHAGPGIDSTFTWLEKSAPPLTFANGKLSSPLTAPLLMRHPDFSTVAVMIDTNKTDPVTPRMLDDAKVMGYLTANAFYVKEPSRPGQMKVYDFSKSADPKPVTLDAAFYESARVIFNRVLYPTVFVLALIFLIFWNGAWSLIYALVGLLLNGLTEGGLGFGALCAIALYAQTPAAVLQGAGLIAGISIPKWPMVSLVITGAYIWLAIKKIAEPAEPAPAA